MIIACRAIEIIIKMMELAQEPANYTGFRKHEFIKVITNPMFIVCLIIFIGIIVVIYWNYIRPRQCKTFYKKLLQFAGFRYSHLTNQERESCREAPQDTREATHNNNSHNNAHFIIYGSSGSGKTSFLKHYLAQRPHDKSCDNPRSYLVFGRDEREFPSQNFVPLLQLEKVSIESLANKIVVLDDAGAYKNLRLKVEDLFRFGRHLGLSRSLCKGCSSNREGKLLRKILNN